MSCSPRQQVIQVVSPTTCGTEVPTRESSTFTETILERQPGRFRISVCDPNGRRGLV
jgi:hypothetical protein